MPRTVRLAIALAAAAVALGVLPAPSSGDQRRPDAEQGEKEKQAVAHYEKGQQHYNLGEFDQAIVEYKAAYALTLAPGLLFNIAQAYRLKKNHEQALFFYYTYLREDPEAENRADVEMLIVELEKLKSAPVTPVEPPEDPPPEDPLPDDKPKTMVVQADQVVVNSPDVTDVEPERRYPGRTKKIIGLSAMGAGVLLGGVGLYFGMKARDAGDDISKLSDDRGMWNQDWEDLYQRGKTYETTQIIAYTAGGIFLAGGVVFYFLGHLEDRAAARALDVAIAPTPGGASMVITCDF
jgi:tetratricopeptide (TPR) repeat protein